MSTIPDEDEDLVAGPQMAEDSDQSDLVDDPELSAIFDSVIGRSESVDREAREQARLERKRLQPQPEYAPVAVASSSSSSTPSVKRRSTGAESIVRQRTIPSERNIPSDVPQSLLRSL